MADVYRVELSWDGVSVTGDQPPVHQFGPRPRVFLLVKNWPGFVSAGVPVLKAWALEAWMYMSTNGSGDAEYRAQFLMRYWNELTSDHTDDEEFWDEVLHESIAFPGFAESFRLEEPIGSNGAAYKSGGTLAIEKDEAAGVMRFITPIGTMTMPLHYTGGVFGVTDFDEQNALGIYFLGHGHHMQRPNFSTAETATAKFHDAINRKNGTITDQVAMSTTDPGFWFPTEVTTNLRGNAIPYNNGGGPPMESDDGQEATRYRMKVTWDPADDLTTFPLGRSHVTRRWRMVSAGGTGANFRDMTHAAEHGPLWATYVLPADISKIRLRTTYDNFHSSVVTNAYDNAMSANECPNINWFEDRLWLVWYDGTVIKQSFSQDWGTNWSTPVDLTLAGTNPRHLVDPASGTSFYFYIDSMQSLVLKRSGDFGKTFWDSSAITVKTNVGLQTVAAQFASDGSIIAGWIDALSGDWVQYKSQDRGTTWI